MCGRITQNLQLESLIAKYHLRNQPELDLIPHYNGAPGARAAGWRPGRLQ